MKRRLLTTVMAAAFAIPAMARAPDAIAIIASGPGSPVSKAEADRVAAKALELGRDVMVLVHDAANGQNEATEHTIAAHVKGIESVVTIAAVVVDRARSLLQARMAPGREAQAARLGFVAVNGQSR